MWIVLNNTVGEILGVGVEADRADQSRGLFVFIIGYIQYCILSFTVDKEKAAVANSSIDSSSNNRSSFAPKTKWLIWMTTKHTKWEVSHRFQYWLGPILIRHRVLLWIHRSRCFSLAGCAAVFILNCSSFWLYRVLWRGERDGVFLFLRPLGQRALGLIRKEQRVMCLCTLRVTPELKFNPCLQIPVHWNQCC